MPMLALDNVVASYIPGVEILRGVSLRVEPGEIVCLVGPNGAGKSTVLRTISGFLKPSKGTIIFNGKPIGGMPPERVLREGITHVPQGHSVFPKMTVHENLLIGAFTVKDAALVASRLERVYEIFPFLKQRTRDKAGNLSGGQQKMLEFAKAWTVRPRLCLVDEPSIGLAPRIAEEVYGWIGLFASQGMTILLVDHNVRRVVRMAEYVYVLSLGEITARGRREEFEGDLHEQVRAWLGVNF